MRILIHVNGKQGKNKCCFSPAFSWLYIDYYKPTVVKTAINWHTYTDLIF